MVNENTNWRISHFYDNDPIQRFVKLNTLITFNYIKTDISL